MTQKEKALQLHAENRGKLEVTCKVDLRQPGMLTLAYTPGVAEPCREIAGNPDLAYTYTFRSNMCAIITDGSSVLGLGNIGGLAGLPVMEGKAALFKTFGGVDCFPICLSTQDPDEIVRTCISIAPTFGGINLEDISAPRCFEIQRRLQEALDIPVFHDDQQGSGVTVAAGLMNALKLTGRRFADAVVVINGAGAAGTATAETLLSLGVGDVIVLDSAGILVPGRENMNWAKEELAARTNRESRRGGLAQAIRGANVFVGLSKAGALPPELIGTMEKDPIVFALANPEPEIRPDAAKAAGAAIVGTGRSDFPNQVNNVLAFPGIFRGAFDVRASAITDNMQIAAARAIAGLVGDELSAEYILPRATDMRVGPAVAAAVAEAARLDGVARI